MAKRKKPLVIKTQLETADGLPAEMTIHPSSDNEHLWIDMSIQNRNVLTLKGKRRDLAFSFIQILAATN